VTAPAVRPRGPSRLAAGSRRGSCRNLSWSRQVPLCSSLVSVYSPRVQLPVLPAERADHRHHGDRGANVGFLTYPIFAYYFWPYPAQLNLAYDAAFLLLVFVLLIIIAGRLVVAYSGRHSK
jgi:hypothetical protein